MKELKIFKNKKKLIVIISLGIIFFLALAINMNTIWTADDYCFYNNVWSNNQEFSLKRVLESTTNFYLNWTGRFASTYFNYIFLFFNKNIFNIINSLMFTLLIFLIYKIIKSEKEDNPFLLIISFFLIWFFIPQLGQVAFWKIGSIIYMWTLLSVLTISLFFVKLLKNQDKVKNNFINIIMLFIFAIIAGNGFETNSIMLITFLSFSIAYIKLFKKQKLPLWSIFTFLGSIIGFATNFFSPGNAARMSSMGTKDSFFNTLKFGTGSVFFRGILETHIYVLLILIIFLYLLYLLSVNKDKKRFFKSKIATIPLLLTVFVTLLLTVCIKFHNYSIGSFLEWFYIRYKLFNCFVMIMVGLILTVILLSYLLRKRIFKNTNETVNIIYLFFITSALIGISAYIFTPLAWPRSYMGMSCFLIIAIGYILNNIMINVKHKSIYQYLILIIISILFLGSYYFAITDIYKTKIWFNKIEKQITEEIKNGKEYILVETYVSKNEYNAASVEKWVIPIIVKDTDYVTKDGIHIDYEWINKAMTNYFFKNSNAWNEGKRVIGY